MMKIFFDTEFTGLHKDTTLISIGLLSENGEQFYAELTDYDKSQVDEWIDENVIRNLKGKEDGVVVGNKLYVRERLHAWLCQFDTVEWISDVCHYDFVLLVDLLVGHALNMPYGKWGSSCHDINQDIANFLYINELEAFDYTREQLLEEYGIRVKGVKHNALYDAEVIRQLYHLCNSRKL